MYNMGNTQTTLLDISKPSPSWKWPSPSVPPPGPWGWSPTAAGAVFQGSGKGALSWAPSHTVTGQTHAMYTAQTHTHHTHASHWHSCVHRRTPWTSLSLTICWVWHRRARGRATIIWFTVKINDLCVLPLLTVSLFTILFYSALPIYTC